MSRRQQQQQIINRPAFPTEESRPNLSPETGFVQGPGGERRLHENMTGDSLVGGIFMDDLPNLVESDTI